MSFWTRGNTPEFNESLYEWIMRYYDDFREAAKKGYNARGIHIPGQVTTTGLETAYYRNVELMWWHGGAGWMTGYLWRWYEATQDMEVLKKVYPLLKDAADYICDCTGICGKNYTVSDLAAGGSFYYRVKAHYIDGTSSQWSKSSYVVLSGSSHDYQAGDVNHDGALNIQDVTALINFLLNGGGVCETCADVDGDEIIGITDVTTLISILLNKN